MKVLTGKEPADHIKRIIRRTLSHGDRLYPVLAIIQVGDNEASNRYVANKVKDCKEVGIEANVFKFPADATTEEVLRKVEVCNRDTTINGIIVQLPLPKGMDTRTILDRISPEKDVDGLSTVSVGKLYTGQGGFRPCTPSGVIELLHWWGVQLTGKSAVVVGRSDLVGKPLAKMLMDEGCTVTIMHSQTPALHRKLHQYDIICLATGQPHFVNAHDVMPDWAKDESKTVIDIGISFKNGKLVGDYNPDYTADEINYSPVPGGVGLMTRAALLDNTLTACIQQNLKPRKEEVAWRDASPHTLEKTD